RNGTVTTPFQFLCCSFGSHAYFHRNTGLYFFTFSKSNSITESGKTKPRKPLSFSVPHAELAQAFTLRTPKSDIANKLATPSDIQEIWDLLLCLSQSFGLKRFALAENKASKEERTTLMLQEHVRLHTQDVRNWTYYKTAFKLYNKLYAPLDNIYEKHIGISATSLIRTFRYVIEHIEKTTSQHWERLRPVITSKSISHAVNNYYQISPNLKGSPTELIHLLNKECKNLQAAKAFLMSHADLYLPDCFIFSVHSIAKSLAVSEKQLSEVLPRLSLTFGDLAQENPEHFFLDNPVWSKPLIQLQNGSFFCILPIIFTNFGFRIIEHLLQDTKAKIACSERRAEFLESEIASLLTTAFPQAEYALNLVWDEYETDFLLKFESVLLIVEAKSGSVSIPALRGAPKRLRQHIKELIVEPAQQSLRLEKKILAAQSNPEKHSSFLKQIPFDIADIKTIVRLSATLEDFADIQANLSLLKEENLIDQTYAPVPTIILADLDIVMDILQTPAERTHYLLRRNELENYQIKFFGSELDILGLYLENGLNIASVQGKDIGVFLMEMAEPINEYYVAMDFNIRRKKPRLKQTTWWHDILSRLETKRPQCWLEASIMLLNYPIDEQAKAERAFRRIKKHVQKNWRNPKHMNSVIVAPPHNRQDALAFIAFKKQNWDRRHDLMKNIVTGVFEDTQATRCLVIGTNIDSNHYPYSISGILFRK
ncbi:MAG: hypothetical protein ACYS8Y_12230, partial [Planctomycetota bacterium]